MSGVIHTVKIVQSAPTVNLLYHISYGMSGILFARYLILIFIHTTYQVTVKFKIITGNNSFFVLWMWQNPREADAMTKVQAELDETKIVLVSF